MRNTSITGRSKGILFAYIIEVLLLIGTYVVNYFTRKRMGMARYVIYMNQKWEENYPIDKIQIAAVLAFLLLTALLLGAYFKRRKSGKINFEITIFLVLILTVVFIVFTILKSAETLRSYYFISILLGIALILQIIIGFVSVLKGEKVKKEIQEDIIK